ncbi:cytidine deaminase [Legionella jamestowniensis]|uniref:Cytidine deaminase n=1 Tax=Legionella jamestowniensis TaxID=455 RepID=A0A0W0UU82_9GAMM|nr:cytidine deaminase [Legionella jamestowniensis]KTD11424.1 cytidine deaminase [Legionella jamestowniensis]OCH98723.1 cytidine deaminase [Legionella jamestowniensis]SFL67491.1 cytidine deaminase [Legionella jamestowniensis DSM 19215]
MVNLETSMINQARQALTHAYAPYSNFRVASCVCSEDGSLYTGVNVENASYGLSICAETAAICHMITAGQQKIKSMVVLNGENTPCPPCGACRQRIIEFSEPNTAIHLCNDQAIIKTLTIAELLPEAFKLKP